MKKIIVAFLSSLLVVTSCNTKKDDSCVRTAEVIETDYFSSYRQIDDETTTRLVAQKYFKGDTLRGYDTVSMVEEDYLITYDTNIDYEAGLITMNVYFDSTNESITESFTGVPMTNYNDEADILFTIDDMHIFLSEMKEMLDPEAYSTWGNILHKTANAAMMATVVYEPAMKVFSKLTPYEIIRKLYSTVKNASYIANYERNKQKTQPNDYVYGQHAYKDWKFGIDGISNMSWAGCEIIAAYNLQRALGKGQTLAETIFSFEGLGIEFGGVQGYFGSNPFQISYYLIAMNIKYDKVITYKNFEKKMNDNNNYYVILSVWNGEDATDGVHTFMIDKDVNAKDRYVAYNYYCNLEYELNKTTTKKNDYKFYFDGTPSKVYVCAYFINK